MDFNTSWYIEMSRQHIQRVCSQFQSMQTEEKAATRS
jgi:hypothetical protein